MNNFIEEHKINVQKTARVYSITPKGEVKGVLYAIHGYRQLGAYFVKHFLPLLDHGIEVIVPEGLHRFYVEGYSGRVGASWMTKEARLDDINDYISYLNQVHSTFKSNSHAPCHLLGFSQGGPTACRWLAESEIPFERLILHSTVFPNDFDFESNKARLSKIKSFAIFGDDDQFALEETIKEKMAWMNGKGVFPKLMRFKGGHQIAIDQVLLAMGK
ncbi:MAG: hypothetical protein WEC59_04750 [Salibacteraceae bacterium]